MFLRETLGVLICVVVYYQCIAKLFIREWNGSFFSTLVYFSLEY